MEARAGKYKLRGKSKLGARARADKFKLGARAGKYKLGAVTQGARVRAMAKQKARGRETQRPIKTIYLHFSISL